jgi:hypothetical protein
MFWSRHCALILLRVDGYPLAGAVCLRAAHETGTCRSLRSPTGSVSAIGWHNPDLKVDIGLHCGCRLHPQIGHARASGRGRTKEFSQGRIPMNNENLTLHFKVKDFNAWQTSYNGNEKNRASAGITKSKVFRSTDDPNDVLLLQDVADVSKARTWYGSSEMKSVMEKGGVVGSPSIRAAA